MTESENETNTLCDSTIQHMYDTVLNHKTGFNVAKRTHLICRINWMNAIPTHLTKTSIPDGQGIKHAEKKLIEDLNKPNRSQMTTITIYMNNSPCSSKDHTCAMELIKFLNENVHIVLILYVTNLYNIRRASCMKESHYTYVSETNHEANFTGLKDLMNHDRCVVSAFSYAVWSELLHSVPVSMDFRRDILKDYSIEFVKNDRSRKDEDNRIRSDLLYIRYLPSYFNNTLPS